MSDRQVSFSTKKSSLTLSERFAQMAAQSIEMFRSNILVIEPQQRQNAKQATMEAKSTALRQDRVQAATKRAPTLRLANVTQRRANAVAMRPVQQPLMLNTTNGKGRNPTLVIPNRMAPVVAPLSFVTNRVAAAPAGKSGRTLRKGTLRNTATKGKAIIQLQSPSQPRKLPGGRIRGGMGNRAVTGKSPKQPVGNKNKTPILKGKPGKKGKVAVASGKASKAAKSKKAPSKDALDKDMDSYFGKDHVHENLNSALDDYFGK